MWFWIPCRWIVGSNIQIVKFQLYLSHFFFSFIYFKKTWQLGYYFTIIKSPQKSSFTKNKKLHLKLFEPVNWKNQFFGQKENKKLKRIVNYVLQTSSFGGTQFFVDFFVYSKVLFLDQKKSMSREEKKYLLF